MRLASVFHCADYFHSLFESLGLELVPLIPTLEFLSDFPYSYAGVFFFIKIMIHIMLLGLCSSFRAYFHWAYACSCFLPLNSDL